MPMGMGAPGVGSLAAAGSSLGIPQAGAVPGGGLQDILMQLSSGQMSAEKLLMLLALLSQGGGGQLPSPAPPPLAPGGGGGGPIGAALGVG